MKLSPLSQTGDTLDGIFFRFGANFLAGKKKKTDERTEGREKQLRRKFQLLLLKRQQQQKNSNKVKASKGTPAEPPNLTLFPRKSGPYETKEDKSKDEREVKEKGEIQGGTEDILFTLNEGDVPCSCGSGKATEAAAAEAGAAAKDSKCKEETEFYLPST
ncbi:hypothetical protein RUM44_006164 [Polyplax serrata]|uniref:Uncharacterized protein n=1 Tax=Polyplax serrata TaxID=468196 RepID=A0ABR1AZU6_POLSC